MVQKMTWAFSYGSCALAAMWFATAPAVAQPPDVPFAVQNIAVGDAPRVTASADFNSDGLPDLAIGFRDVNDGSIMALQVLLQDKAGQFAPAFAMSQFPSVELRDVTAGDLNADGVVDLALTFRGGFAPVIASGIQVLHGNNDGTFTPLGPNDGFLETCSGSQFTSFADFDGDGDRDIATAAQLCFGATILRNDANSSFQHNGTYGAGYHLHGNALADIDSDGDLDIVGWTLVSAVKIILNFGDATFTQNNQGDNHFSVAANVGGVAVFDLDDDGRPDIATTSLEHDVISILWNEGNLQFTRIDYPTGSDPLDIGVADFDVDGRIDIAVSSTTGNAIRILTNAGNRQIDPPHDIVLFTPIDRLRAVDVDRNGAVDLVAVSTVGDSVHILRNQSPIDSPGDVDHTGVVDVFDLLTLLDNWGECDVPCPPLCAGDTDGNCNVNVFDLLTVLSDWD